MALDFSSLTDRATCDAATAEIEFELNTFNAREVVGDVADQRATRTKTSTAAQLAKVNSKIASADILLATAGIDAELLETTTDERAALLVQQTRLIKRNRLATGLARFLADVDAAQVEAQVATLTAIKDGIAAHRATLPA
ncbi:hypothetical protein SAMN02745146_2288 [Hymenobacter daecheongensis DSM 21074]|uniref:Uncharacterized protein n=1 Tax=Hymenobacter daecheongensis DSM 21074 TaxID=1121955 RepID=A0A1M6GJT4_9BACT|nr:hypothetical protein [Hymenobacter daecheongensis]SHJ10181.1 hypothetical protein SAMN02745146_2288 [Hymenobacter daecheongensis DSM 21074]